MRCPLSLVILPLLAAPLAGQAFIEDFNYPNGPTIPGWTAASGSWVINNGRLSASGSGWRYIVYNGLLAQNCVMDGEFFMVGSTLQFGGLTARHPSATSTSNLVMCKIQNNSSPGPANLFNRIYIYEQPGSSIYMDIPLPRPTSAFCRMIVLDSEAWMQVDADKDGIFETVLGPRPLTVALAAGLVGMNSYGACEMDNFKFYDAVLMEMPGATPRIGTAYNLQLRTPPPSGTQPATYICLASLSKAGIPIGNRNIPLGFDQLFAMTLSVPSIFANFSGQVDQNGAAFPTINIPNLPIAVGLHLYVAGFTLDASKPMGIGYISNEHHIEILP